MKFVRFSGYFVLALVIFFGPLYGAGRIILPEWIKSQVASVLPSDSKLSVGKIYSTATMGVVYENIVLELSDSSLIIDIDNLLIEPSLSISKPAKISIGKGLVKTGKTEVVIKNINAALLLENLKNSELSLLGQIKKIEGVDSALLSNIEFLFQGLTSVNKTLNANAEEVFINLTAPEGPVSVELLAVDLKGKIDNSLSLNVAAKESKVDLSLLGGGNPNRILLGENFLMNAGLVKRDQWSMPIKFKTEGLTSPVGYLGSSLKLEATGVWNQALQDCQLPEIISSNVKCGRMTDVVDVGLDFESGNGALSFSGQGYCVTPNANCPQVIESLIKTKQTAEILSKVIVSGILDPIVGGVILGSLLSGPSSESLDYDHQASIKVEGNRVFLNGKPII